MDQNEAVELLGLSPNPSDDEVNSAYRRLSRETHPDTGGAGADFALLTEARATLLRSEGSALVPFEQVRDLVEAIAGGANDRAKKLERRDEFQGVVRQAIQVRTTRLSRYQRMAALLTFVSGVLAAATQLGRAVLIAPGVSITAIGVAFLGFFVMLGLMVAVLVYLKSQIETDINEAAEALDDKQSLVDLMTEILVEAEINSKWTAAEWHDAVDLWAKSSRRRPDSRDRRSTFLHYARRMGAYEFSRLVAAKAKEFQVVAAHEAWEQNRLVVSYDFNRAEP